MGLYPERTSVATSFIYSGDRVALVKRSASVGTYQGAWAAFSGYVENLPLEQARIELLEEAGLTPEQVRLRGIGVPVQVDDEAEGLRWLVFPFLFELLDGVEVKTDWEAEEFAWFHPQDLSSLPTVPGLDQALRRVWPPTGDDAFWSGLSEVATDKRSGATSLAKRGLETLGEYVHAAWDQLDHETLLRTIRAFAASRPSMGVFPNLAARLILAMDVEGGQLDLDVLITELMSAVDDAAELSVANAADGLAGIKRLFTLSYSESVRDTIMKWRHVDSTIVVAESNPGREGLALADYLSNEGVKVEVVSDSHIASAVQEVDAVLVGCDAITEMDEIENKVGTCLAVSTAKGLGIPVYLVAQTYKIIPPGWPTFIEVQEATEGAISRERHTNLQPVFDLTPMSAFQIVYTEEGVLTTSRLSEIRTQFGSVELIPE